MNHLLRLVGRSLLLLAILVAPGWAQRGALTLPRNLGDLTTQAQTIFRGHVVSAHVEPHPELRNLSTVVVTLQVAETMKGEPGRVFTFRQFIWDVRDRYDAAGYRKGQELLLLMNAATKYGLSSPTGLDQGRFRIERDAQGRATAVNGVANQELFKGMQARVAARGMQLSRPAAATLQQHRHGPVALDELREIIHQFARTQ